ncbi:MAG: hydroxymethylglutaryl-CoA lyase [Aestuariivirga sp.]
MPKAVRIVEVGPRDGLQNEARIVPVSARIKLIEDLLAAGCRTIEAGSFVSPKWIPQMEGTAEVLSAFKHRTDVSFPVLVPNEKGFDAALAAGVKEVAIFAAASETFSRKNINCSIAESMSRFAPVAGKAKQHGVKLRGYVSCVLGCPYEGDIGAEAAVHVARQLHALGCYEISLGDTIGVGTPERARNLVRLVAGELPLGAIAVHFHDTYGQALANIYACLEEGVTVIDSSVAGLGGCPYAKGASGNVATEDVVYMLNGLGITTGIDIKAVAKAGQAILDLIGKTNQSKAARALLSPG